VDHQLHCDNKTLLCIAKKLLDYLNHKHAKFYFINLYSNWK